MYILYCKSEAYWLNETIDCVTIDFNMTGVVGIECAGCRYAAACTSNTTSIAVAGRLEVSKAVC